MPKYAGVTRTRWNCGEKAWREWMSLKQFWYRTVGKWQRWKPIWKPWACAFGGSLLSRWEAQALAHRQGCQARLWLIGSLQADDQELECDLKFIFILHLSVLVCRMASHWRDWSKITWFRVQTWPFEVAFSPGSSTWNWCTEDSQTKWGTWSSFLLPFWSLAHCGQENR